MVPGEIRTFPVFLTQVVDLLRKRVFLDIAHARNKPPDLLERNLRLPDQKTRDQPVYLLTEP
ncbi:hypothetical protein QWE_24093 [Agrobacterium albertimagni AOL15]|uniref:Uncharacterized protein n=1 Tax=Agrobacterium albertimagni AOL15 TaxID=1156935 RepID=K2Q7P4_9HYPH|nr:hypothetical protein QWE_24093 [Agrobacterium albertimagni AOL15]